MRHTAGGRFVAKASHKGTPSRHHGGLPKARDLDPPTHKAARVGRHGQKPSKKGW